LSGHDLCPGRGADGVGKTVGETDASLGQFVQVGRLAGFAAVGGQGFVTHVVGHDEDDVRLIILKLGKSKIQACKKSCANEKYNV